MKTTQNPVRTTVFFGLIFGLSFIPLSLQLSYFIPWPKAYWIILCLYIAAYGFFLTRLSQKSLLRIFPSLLFLFPAVFLTSSTTIFLLIALGFFSWIRSGICFQTLQAKRFYLARDRLTVKSDLTIPFFFHAVQVSSLRLQFLDNTIFIRYLNFAPQLHKSLTAI